MQNQYDSIAVEYQNIKKRFLYKIVDYSLKNALGRINSLNILDLACGDGYVTRQLKSYGANKVIGVDGSKEMIKLAKLSEKHSPLGIKYICSPVQNLGYVDKFDLVTGIFLLHYAKNKNELFQMCKVISENLKNNGRFIGANNKGLKKNLFNDFSKYDFKYVVDDNIKDGQEFKLIVEFENNITKISMYHYSRKTYNKILQEAGFKNIQWLNFLLPPEAVSNPKYRKWNSFGKISAECLLICGK